MSVCQYTVISVTAGEDYTAISQQFTIGSNTSSQAMATPSCVTVNTVLDSVLEGNETFILTIYTTGQSLVLLQNTANVIIKDNTSKQ